MLVLAGLDRSPQGLAVDWIRANVAAAVAGFVLGLAAFGVREMLGMPDPDAGVIAKAVLVLAEVLAAAATSTIYAMRTGAVLLRKLPAFPPLTWNTFHAMIGIGVGLFVAVTAMGAEPAAREGPAASVILSIAIGGVLAGSFLGAAMGGAQALILHKAAREVGDWVRWSALAGTTFGAYALALNVGPDQTLANEILIQLIGFVVAVAAGLVMLPAFHRLQPR